MNKTTISDVECDNLIKNNNHLKNGVYEINVREMFAIIHRELGYEILDSKRHFPDYILKDIKTREELETEAKVRASDVRKYDPDEIDAVVCWEDDLDYRTRNKYDVRVIPISSQLDLLNDKMESQLKLDDKPHIIEERNKYKDRADQLRGELNTARTKKKGTKKKLEEIKKEKEEYVKKLRDCRKSNRVHFEYPVYGIIHPDIHPEELKKKFLDLYHSYNRLKSILLSKAGSHFVDTSKKLREENKHLREELQKRKTVKEIVKKLQFRMPVDIPTKQDSDANKLTDYV